MIIYSYYFCFIFGNFEKISNGFYKLLRISNCCDLHYTRSCICRNCKLTGLKFCLSRTNPCSQLPATQYSIAELSFFPADQNMVCGKFCHQSEFHLSRTPLKFGSFNAIPISWYARTSAPIVYSSPSNPFLSTGR